jgi:PhoPQ-activated pathogenicity-related protein
MFLLNFELLQSVIRAMDTVAAFASTKKPSANITKFAIAGASKVGG